MLTKIFIVKRIRSSNSEGHIVNLFLNYNSQLLNWWNVNELRNRNCLFVSLYKIIFNWNYGSFSCRLLMVEHINNKDLYINEEEDDFDDIQN